MELKLEHVSYVYNPGSPFETRALDDVSMTIGDSEFIGMIGHTGSGKSTLVQHLNGLLLPTEGKVLADGQDITADHYPLKDLRCRVGLVFQYPEYQLFESDVLSDVSFGPKNQGLSADEAAGKAREAMRIVGLDESFEKRSPFELSGGQKRKAAIAGILAMTPIVLISHSMEDVADYVSRIVVLDKGKICWDDAPEKIFVHVKELEEIGLAAPQVSYVMSALRERGWNVDPSAATIDAAAAEILRACQ